MTVIFNRDGHGPMIAVLLSAVLYSLTFPNPFFQYGLGWMAWLALVPLFIGLRDLTFSRRIYFGLVFGFVVYALILQWLWPLHIAGTLLFVLVLCLQPLIFIVFFPRQIHLSNLLYVPSLWAASEWLRALLLNGFCFSLGYSQAFIPQMAQLASWGGSYAVAFVIVFANYCLFLAVRDLKNRKPYLVLAVTVLAANFCYGSWRILELPSGKVPILVAGIQPNIQAQDKLNAGLYDSNMERHVALTKKALQDRNADLVVWPETAFPWDVLNDPIWHERVKQLARDSQVPLLLGTATVNNTQNFNSALMISPDGTTAGVYHKNQLVPLCEYCPKNKFFQWIQKWSHLEGFDFSAGKQQPMFSISPAARPSVDFGVLICSESCYPKAARRLSRQGADFVVVMLNDAWFNKPEAMMVHAQNAVMRAIETGRDFVSVANTGWTFRADNRGLINGNDALPLQKPDAAIFPAFPREKQTPYARIGDIFSVACMLFVIIIRLHRRPRSMSLES